MGLVPELAMQPGILCDASFLGTCAVDLVDAQLRRNERGVPPKQKSVLVNGIWNEGTTLRPFLNSEPGFS